MEKRVVGRQGISYIEYVAIAKSPCLWFTKGHKSIKPMGLGSVEVTFKDRNSLVASQSSWGKERESLIARKGGVGKEYGLLLIMERKTMATAAPASEIGVNQRQLNVRVIG